MFRLGEALHGARVGAPGPGGTFPTLRLVRIDPARKQRRYYVLTATRGLFGDWLLVREWGRIGQAGRVRTDWHTTHDAALGALAGLRRRKLARGYRPENPGHATA